MSNGIRLHPRTRVVQRAERKIGDVIEQAREEFGLTAVELLQILSSAQLHVLKYELRRERHPGDPGRNADEE